MGLLSQASHTSPVYSPGTGEALCSKLRILSNTDQPSQCSICYNLSFCLLQMTQCTAPHPLTYLMGSVRVRVMTRTTASPSPPGCAGCVTVERDTRWRVLRPSPVPRVASGTTICQTANQVNWTHQAAYKVITYYL